MYNYLQHLNQSYSILCVFREHKLL